MKKIPFCPAEDEEPGIAVLNSCILFCDVFIAGNGIAVGLKFDEENMFVPMLVIAEKDAAAELIIQTAEALGTPVISNAILAKNLASSGKVGEGIHEASYREVSMVFARIGTQKRRLPLQRQIKKSRMGDSAKVSRPLSVELGMSIYELISADGGDNTLLAAPLALTRKRLIRLLGFTIPSFRISRSAKLKRDEYRIFFKGLEAGRGRMELSWYSGSSGMLANGKYDDNFDAAFPSINCPDMMSLPENIHAAARAVSTAIIRHVNEITGKRAPELLGRDEVQAILDAAEEKCPVVAGEVKSLLPLGIVREIFQGLVSEQVSIRHTATILETIADWASFGPTPPSVIIEQIRQSLKRQICLEYADDKLTLRVLTLNPDMEKDFSSASMGSGCDNIKNESEGAEDSISSAVCRMTEKGFPPVILCSPKARLHVKEFTREKLPNLTVLSYVEIPTDIKVESVGEIGQSKKTRSNEKRSKG